MTLTILCPLGIEARAARRGAQTARVLQTGMGPARSRRATLPDGPVAVVGLGGALVSGIVAGDVVVATEVTGPDGRRVSVPGAALVAEQLRRAGLAVHSGPIASVERVATGAERHRLAELGAIAVDMESVWLLAGRRGPHAVVRVIVDTPDHELRSPGTVGRGLRAVRTIRRMVPALETWAGASRSRTVILAGPRSFCAGVERAIEIVERALERYGPPVYVRKQIVHNTHVVHELEQRGAIFVDELDGVPDDSLVVLAAHGVSPEVHAEVHRRKLDMIDATCPLVAKVHSEARRFADQGYSIVLIGHRDHEEIEGTLGEAPDRIQLVTTPDDVAGLEVPDPERVAFLTQTTLAVDEVDEVVVALHDRFPALTGPRADDICYATQNRQEAVRALAAETELIIVVGSPNSSNSQRLTEVAEREGCPARLVDSASDLDPAWLTGVGTLGITAGASAPERLVQDVVRLVESLGPVDVLERTIVKESVRFALPVEVR